MNRTAAANPRRVFVFVDYRPLSGEGGGRGGVGWGGVWGRGKKSDRSASAGACKKKKKEFQPEQCFLCHAEQKAKRFVYLRAAEEGRGRQAEREAFARLQCPDVECFALNGGKEEPRRREISFSVKDFFVSF